MSLDLGIVNMPSASRHAKRTRHRCTFVDQAAELRSKVHAICGKAASGSLRRTDFAKCNIVANPARLVALHHVMKRLGAEGKLSMPSAVAVYLAKWSEFADI